MSKINLRQRLEEGQKNPDAPTLEDSDAVVVVTGNTPEPKRAAMVDGRLSRDGTTAKTIPQSPATVAVLRRVVGGSNKGTVFNHLMCQGLAAAIVLSYKSGGKTLVRETADEHNGKMQSDLELIFGKKSADVAMQAFQWGRENPAT